MQLAGVLGKPVAWGAACSRDNGSKHGSVSMDKHIGLLSGPALIHGHSEEKDASNVRSRAAWMRVLLKCTCPQSTAWMYIMGAPN
jgi:hypothetical protein